MRKNVILIGMPGAGKSTVGVVLAKMLGYSFLDSDLVIQNATGKRLSTLIGENGPEGFIRIEEEILSGIEAEGTVIATGGSAVYGERAMEHFRENGVIVYLSLPFRTVESRLGDLKKRGVVLREGQDLRAAFSERTVLYRKYADLIPDIRGKRLRETAETVCSEVEEWLKKSAK